MKTLIYKSLALAIVCSFSGSTFAAVAPVLSRETVDLVGSYKVQRFKLQNGLKLLVVEDHTSPTFAYQTWYRIGSKDEVVGKTGLAHLFEHLMFKATKTIKDGEFMSTIEKFGGEDLNAFTTRDATVYHQELPKLAKTDTLDMIAKLESDRMQNLIVDDKAFKTEREVVQNERRQRVENNPDAQIQQAIYEMAFTKSSYRWPVIGYAKDLSDMTSKDAFLFYKKHYGPAQATIVVAGDVKADEVLEKIQKYYGSIPNEKPAITKVPDEPVQKTARTKTLKLEIQVEKLVMAYHIPPVLNAERAGVEVLQNILATGRSSRLTKALVDKGIATSVQTETVDDENPTLMLIEVALQKGKKASQAEAVILKTLEDLKKTPVTDQELDRARNQLGFSFYENFTNHNSMGMFIGLFETKGGGFENGAHFYQNLKNVTAEQIRDATQKFFAANSRSVVMGVPK